MTKKTKINTKLMKYLKLNIKYTDIRNKEAFYFHHTLGYFDYLKNYVITMEQFLVIKLLKKVLKWTRFFLLSKICALLNYESTSQTYLFVDVLQNSCFSKFRNIHRKTPVLESLFNKEAACNFIKNRLQQRSFPLNIAEFLRIAFF